MKRLKSVRLIPVCIILMAALIFITACKSAPATPTQTTPGTQPSATETPATLKIGVMAWFGWDAGQNMIQGLQVMTDMDNQNGGLTIGAKKYPIQLIIYDSGTNYVSSVNTQNTNQNSAVASVNHLIFQDKVNFILSDPSGVDNWLNLTEANKVVLCAASPTTPILSPNNHYSFQSGFMNSQPVALAQWFATHYPAKKSIAIALPDDPQGHKFADINQKAFEASGMKVTTIFYPSPSTGIPDINTLDAVGSQVKNLNPDVFLATGGFDQNVYQSVWGQGYRGQFISQLPLSNLVSGVSVGALEGLIGIATPAEFDPASTQQAQQYKQAFTSKHMWDSVGLQYLGTWSSLRAALQQAGSLDPDKVSAVLGNGLKFEGPFGTAEMVSRPDQGNSKTVDSVVAPYIYKVSGGKATMVDNLTLDEAVSAFKQFYK